MGRKRTAVSVAILGFVLTGQGVAQEPESNEKAIVAPVMQISAHRDDEIAGVFTRDALRVAFTSRLVTPTRVVLQLQLGDHLLGAEVDLEQKTVIVDGHGHALSVDQIMALQHLGNDLERYLDPDRRAPLPHEDMLYRMLSYYTMMPPGSPLNHQVISAPVVGSCQAVGPGSGICPINQDNFTSCPPDVFCGENDNDGICYLSEECVTARYTVSHDACPFLLGHGFCHENIELGCSLECECLGRCGEGCFGGVGPLDCDLGGGPGAGIYTIDCAEHDRCRRLHGDIRCLDELDDAADDCWHGQRNCDGCPQCARPCGGPECDFCHDGNCPISWIEDGDCDCCCQFPDTVDCGCGNGVCDPGETCNNCPSDCDPTCGDGRCECGESRSNCCRDCAECCSNSDCNDGLFCNGSETCVNGSCQPGTNPCDCNLSDSDCTDCCNEAQNNCTGNEPPGSPCNDGQFCNGTDTCNSSGSCSNHTGDPCPGCDGDSDCSESCNEAQNNCTANDSNACGCNDGLFCTQTDTCSSGTCNGTGNPCSGGPECADTCNEGTDTCNLPPGTPCMDDGNPCTDNVCNGGGTCVPINNTDPCDDGLFCTQIDRCSNGTCIGTGDPCAGGPECADACNEAADNCFDPMSTVCSDTTPDNCFDAFCTGAGACDQDAFRRPAGDACDDPASTDCDNADTCDAVGDCQPNLEPDGTPCPDGLMCNGDETCQSGVCTPGTPIPGCCKVPQDCDDGNDCTKDECNAVTGMCEYPDWEAGRPCGDPSDTVCDDPDTCDGAGTCQPNNEPPSVECRADAGECDVPEFCDGTGGCPVDGFEPPGTVCGDPTDTVCDNPDTCDGAGTCQPNNEPPSVECRADAGECDVPEFCDGAGGCPVDGFELPGTVCGDSGDTVCDHSDTCDGTDTCQPNHEPASVVCRADTGECDVAEFCDGTGSCPADGFEPPGTACGNQNDTDCDNPDSCDGNGTCDPRHEPVATPCGDQADDDCTHPDTCDALGVCLDNHEPDGTFCEDDSFCNGTETCQDGACRDGPDPCIDLVQCDEEDDVCPCTGDEDCDDHVACTIDSCGAADVCNSTRDDSACDNGLFCDGVETCDAVADCQSGAAPCGDGFDCTADTCDEGLDECHNDVESGNCLIDGACYVDEAVNPGNSCQSCQPLTDALVWSPRPDGTTCEDGNDCTSGDACSSGECTGTAIPNCPPPPPPPPTDSDSDGVPNTSDDCPNTAPNAEVDDQGCACEQLDDDDDGVDNCDDLCADTPGTEVPNDTGCSCSQVDCDDGDVCNGLETCQDGTCLDGELLDCNDNNPCTDESCDPISGCENVAIECQDGETCVNGECEQLWELDLSVFSLGSGTLPVPLQLTLHPDGSVVRVFVAGSGVTCDELCPPDSCDGRCIPTPSPEGCPAPCEFREWADPVEDERKHDNPLIVPMDSNKAFTANFQTVVCTEDSDCDDGQFCNGKEECIDGACQPGDVPCSGDQMCDEDEDCCQVWVPPALCGACGDGVWVCVLIGSFGWLGMRLTGSERRRRRGV